MGASSAIAGKQSSTKFEKEIILASIGLPMLSELREGQKFKGHGHLTVPRLYDGWHKTNLAAFSSQDGLRFNSPHPKNERNDESAKEMKRH